MPCHGILILLLLNPTEAWWTVLKRINLSFTDKMKLCFASCAFEYFCCCQSFLHLLNRAFSFGRKIYQQQNHLWYTFAAAFWHTHTHTHTTHTHTLRRRNTLLTSLDTFSCNIKNVQMYISATYPPFLLLNSAMQEKRVGHGKHQTC